MKKIYLYPVWLRIWHWFNALLFLILIISGISLHYSDTGSLFFSFKFAIIAHNISGILLTLIFIFYTINNIITKNYKYYIPVLKGLSSRINRQVKFYILGIFTRDQHPFHANEKQKFNPLQQISYFFIIFIFMPLIIISGWLLMFPELAPNEIIGMGGVWPMAILHTAVGFILSIFMFVHIYLGTTGKTIGELYKSMISGWHLAEEVVIMEEIVLEKGTKKDKVKRLFPDIFYNPVSLIGAFVAFLSFVSILFLILIEFFTEFTNPYSGIIAFVILPTFLLLGIFLIIAGIIRENRKVLSLRPKERKLPVVDLNNPKHQVATIVFSVGALLLIVLSVYGSFKAYEYTDSDEFCGMVCHKVMEPEYTAYLSSPHSRVGCVKCHIGGGADWFVKSKLSGTYQVYAALFNKFPKPVPTPIKNLRPAQETCEQCHWPMHFYSEKKKNFNFFLSDENNSQYDLTMLLKVGGGNVDLELHSGIHWHMNISNEIKYYASDDSRMNIPWVKTKNLMTGEESVFKDITVKIDEQKITKGNLRKFDCIDCHNRPSHQYNPPQKIINLYLYTDKIDKSLPYIKRTAVQALENFVTNRKTAYKDIRSYIWKFYNLNYPEVAAGKNNEIDRAIVEINNIYQRNYFPNMKVNWKKYPDNIGHLYSDGCFRCHDGKHVNNDGKVLSKDCNICHTVLYQKAPNIENTTTNGFIDFIHPGGIDKMVNTRNCSDCHGPKK